MSVKLIIVALLAAVVTADNVTVKRCTGDNCNCSISETTENYPVGQCTTIDGKHWKVDSCTPEEAITMKGYKSAECTDDVVTVSTKCVPFTHRKASCATSDGKTTVTLFSNCASDKCDDGCKSTVFTVSGGSDVTGQCQQVNGKYLKLVTTTCPSEATTTIDFKEFPDADKCGDNQGGKSDAGDNQTKPDAGDNQTKSDAGDNQTKSDAGDNQTKSDELNPGVGPGKSRGFKPRDAASEGTDLKVPQACTTATYRLGTCTTDKKALYSVCPSEVCDGGCVDTTFDLGKEKMMGDDYWIIDNCTANTDLKFKVYTDVKTYQPSCSAVTGTDRAMATCEPEPITTSTGVAAHALSAGVLAIVLCLLGGAF